MKAKNIVIILFSVLAFVAVAVGLGTYFFGFGSIKDIPNAPSVEQVAGEYRVVTNYNPNYSYNFKIEKFVDGQFLNIDNISKTTNFTTLGKIEQFDTDDLYHISVCFTTENGSKGKYSSVYEWKIIGKFESEVNYENVFFDDETLSWEAVAGAETYNYLLVDSEGEEVERNTIKETSLSCKDLGVGQYKIYLNAGVENTNILPSDFGQGFDFVIKRQNEITNVVRQGGNLKVYCSQYVQEFQIFVNDELKLTLPAGEKTAGYFTVDATSLFKDLDFSSDKVEICSLANGLYILGSSKVEIN